MDMRTTSSGCSKASLASRRRLTCHSCHSGRSADAASIGNSWSSVVRSTVGWPTGRPRNFVIPNCADRPWRGSDMTPNRRTAIAWRGSGTSGGRPPGTTPVDRHSGASCAASRAAPKDLTTGRVTWSGPISTRCHRQQAGTLVRISSGPNVKQRSPFCGARCRSSPHGVSSPSLVAGSIRSSRVSSCAYEHAQAGRGPGHGRDSPLGRGEASDGQAGGSLRRGERLDVRGFREVTLRLTDEAAAHGFGAVLPAQFRISVSGRGERASPFVTHLSRPRFLMINRTPRESFPAAGARSA